MGDNLENNTTDRGTAVPYSAARPAATARVISPPRPSDGDLLEAAACSRLVLEAAVQLQDRIDDAGGPDGGGRRPGHRAVDAVMFWVAARECGSERAAADRLGDPAVWDSLADAQRAAHPGLESRLRLSPTAPTRQQYHRFAERWIDDEALDGLAALCRRLALQAADHCGMPDRGPQGEAADAAHRDRIQLIAGDCVRIPALHRFSASERDSGGNGAAHPPGPGELGGDCRQSEQGRRSGPDAQMPETGRSGGEGRPGHTALFATVSSEHPGERLVAAAELADPQRPPSEQLVDKIAGLRRDNPELADGPERVVYDMDIGDGAADRLLARGTNPIIAVRRTRGEQPAEAVLGRHRFKGGGEAAVLDVVSAGGAPAIKLHGDGDGAESGQLLELVSVKRRPSKQGIVVYAEYRVPAGPQVPARLVGLTTLIRLDSTSQQAEDGRRETLEMRPFPQGEGQKLDGLYRARSDAEAANLHFKRSLGGRRSSGLSERKLRLDLLAYQALSVIRALIAHHRRTGADVAAWFGIHKPAARAGARRGRSQT